MMGYDPAIEIKRRGLFEGLSEKDRRRYAGVVAATLGLGGTEYLAGLFGLDPMPLRRGLAELNWDEDPAAGRVRSQGGAGRGRWRRVPANFRPRLAKFTAGDLMRAGVLWPNLSRRESRRRLAEMESPASRHKVRTLMRRHGLGQLQVRKRQALDAHPTGMPHSRTSPRSRPSIGRPVLSAQYRPPEERADRPLRPGGPPIPRCRWTYWTTIAPALEQAS